MSLRPDLLPLSEIVRLPRNPKAHDLELIHQSMDRFGYLERIIVNDTTGRLVAGHGRIDTLEEKRSTGEDPPDGIETRDTEWMVPVDHVSIPERDEYAAAIALNRTVEAGGWNNEILCSVLEDLAANGDPHAFAGTGYGPSDIDELLRQLTSPPMGSGAEVPDPKIEQIEELKAQWNTQPGQLWTIGPHRLLCGDSTNEADVKRLMNGERAALFATDPPYLVDYDGTNHPSGGKWQEKPDPDKNKDWSAHYHDWDNAEQGEALYDDFIRLALEHAIEDSAAWYCWHASRNQAMLERIWQKYGAFVHQQIIWAKTCPVLTRSWYMWQHEPCFFGWVKGKKPKRTVDGYLTTVWSFQNIKPGQETLHPTSKPVELFEIPMQQHTRPGDICYEPFAGSGSQIAAAARQDRICYAMEQEPGFVAVILERLSGMGLTPELDSGTP